MKNKFYKSLSYAILVVLLCTTNFAYAQNPNLELMKPIALKFVFAMVGIILFSMLMSFGLSIYNKFFVSSQIKDFKLRKDSLRNPNDVEDATMMFITKNRLK